MVADGRVFKSCLKFIAQGDPDLLYFEPGSCRRTWNRFSILLDGAGLSSTLFPDVGFFFASA